LLAIGAALLVSAGAAASLAADGAAGDCLSDDNERRIAGCSTLINTPDLPVEQLSLAYGLRALGYSLKGDYANALADYDKALGLKPDFPVALNNRAWVYFKLGRMSEGEGDVERALRLTPASPYALDTRAHIKQAQGDKAGALSDYEQAMTFGGRRIVSMYQCGLRSQGLYLGALDGLYSRALKHALQACVGRDHCDPLPFDSDCTPNVS
jgi:tetratricopeptide (TPR) repeat protein